MAFTAQDQKPDTMGYIQDLYNQIKGVRGIIGGILSNISSALSFVPGGCLIFYNSSGGQVMRIGYLSDGSVGINLNGNPILNASSVAASGQVSGGSLSSGSTVFAPSGVNYNLGNNVRIQKTSATRLDFWTS